MVTHHSHDAGIGLKMFLYHHSFIPEIFMRSSRTHEFSIKTRQILHYTEIVCPGPQSPVSRHELLEVLLAILKKVLNPFRGLG